MEVPRAMQTFPESGLRVAGLKPERRCAGYIRSDTLLCERWRQVGTLKKLAGLSGCVEASRHDWVWQSGEVGGIASSSVLGKNEEVCE